jgi:hypothetical protein
MIYVNASGYFSPDIPFLPNSMNVAVNEWHHLRNPSDDTALRTSSDGTVLRNTTAHVDPRHSNRIKQRQNKQFHRLAYVLLVHANLDQILVLIDALLDPFVTIVIHVDAKNPALKQSLLAHIHTTIHPLLRHRVRVLRQSFNGLWGHVSLVWAQLAGFFELLDMNRQWEYVINLSGNDYPLQSNAYIYRHLKSHGHANFIHHWPSPRESTFN